MRRIACTMISRFRRSVTASSMREPGCLGECMATVSPQLTALSIGRRTEDAPRLASSRVPPRRTLHVYTRHGDRPRPSTGGDTLLCSGSDRTVRRGEDLRGAPVSLQRARTAAWRKVNRGRTGSEAGKLSRARLIDDTPRCRQIWPHGGFGSRRASMPVAQTSVAARPRAQDGGRWRPVECAARSAR